MIIYNKNGAILNNPDMRLGYVEREIIPVTHEYIIDKPEISHEVVIAEYPDTGGKDIEIVVDEPAVGHWNTYDADGNIIAEFDGSLEGFSHDGVVNNTWEIGRYIPFTAKELEERDREEAEIAERTEQRETLLNELPDTLATTDDAICALYEMVLGGNNG